MCHLKEPPKLRAHRADLTQKRLHLNLHGGKARGAAYHNGGAERITEAFEVAPVAAAGKGRGALGGLRHPFVFPKEPRPSNLEAVQRARRDHMSGDISLTQDLDFLDTSQGAQAFGVITSYNAKAADHESSCLTKDEVLLHRKL